MDACFMVLVNYGYHIRILCRRVWFRSEAAQPMGAKSAMTLKLQQHCRPSDGSHVVLSRRRFGGRVRRSCVRSP
ncbi:hypothetical protein B296_00013035 [Ensete ventricosum]|uniref:Uncharacterized protein n=1 Tax=Ensete ventricosum TaxID=4639 RepID=A0A427ABH1_ENSVE|nr:hypothetical protein B296_00013035 [Ensete ventricosum]